MRNDGRELALASALTVSTTMSAYQADTAGFTAAFKAAVALSVSTEGNTVPASAVAVTGVAAGSIVVSFTITFNEAKTVAVLGAIEASKSSGQTLTIGSFGTASTVSYATPSFGPPPPAAEVAPNLAGKTSRGAGRSGTALALALQVGAGAVLCVTW